jgi:hypothetical protein
VSGKLRNSDMIMFDRETESWWQQAIGEAIVGDLTGTELQTLPSWMESWSEFEARNPDGLVMAEPDMTVPTARSCIPVKCHHMTFQRWRGLCGSGMRRGQ